jgi:signal transduction histidine kinase
MKQPALGTFGRRAGILAFVSTLLLMLLAAIGPRHRATESLLPHGYCYSWDPALLRLHVASDALIGLAYTAIPIALVTFIRKRTDLPFNWMFALFGVFIIACGATHWMEVWTLWNPTYWLSGSVKAVTAAASVSTAILLFLLIPRALAIPSTRQLEEAKAALERENQERRRVEAELRHAHDALESRVEARTRELRVANERLEIQRRELEEASRKKSEFLAIVSHELRNPVHAISAGAQYIALASRETSIQDTSAAIERQVAQLSRLLDDLLGVVRGDDGPESLKARNIDLRDVLSEATDNALPLLRSKNQRLESNPGDEPIMVRADARRLCQAITNMLRNAALYSNDDQTITIEVAHAPSSVTVRIRDQGIGLSPEECDSLFDLFRRGERARRKSASGLGIGLHVARQIVLAHGGSIAASSDGPGKGTTFSISLPLVA